MKLTQAQDRGIHLIRGYGDGVVRVAEQELRTPFLLSPERIVSDWSGRTLAGLDDAQLEAIWPMEPRIVLMGTAAALRQAPAAVRRAFERRGIALETMDLGAACRTYNVLAQEDRPVVAALFPQA